MNKHLILIDEQKMILYGLKSFIESSSAWKVSFMASSLEDLTSKMDENDSVLSDSECNEDCFVAIVDIKCGNDSGYDIVNLLREKIPGIKCIMYTMYSTYGNIVYALETGIEGFLSKKSDENGLILALEAIVQGKSYIQQDLMKDTLLVSNKVALLTSREKQVFDLLCDGLDKKEICSRLKITIRTCENYFSVLYSKLGVNDIREMEEKFGVVKSQTKTKFEKTSPSAESESFPKKLKLTIDESYDGDGVKILYSNIPEEATILTVMLHDGAKTNQTTYMEKSTWGKNKEYYDLGYYVYPYLNAGKKYTFEFIYKTRNDKIVDKAFIDVLPSKGKEIDIKMMDKSNLIVDPETLVCSIKENPLPELPPEARIGVMLWDRDWNYIGNLYRNITDADCFGPYDLYNEIDFYPKKHELLHIKKVIIHLYVQYKLYEWYFFISQVYPFKPEKLY